MDGRRAGASTSRRNGWYVVGGLLALAVVVPLAMQSSRPDQDDVYRAAANAADELRSTPVDGLGAYGYDVSRALAAGNPPSDVGKFGSSVASELDVRPAGEDARGDLYEITRDDGAYPVCLVVVEYDSGLSRLEPLPPSASVDEGPC